MSVPFLMRPRHFLNQSTNFIVLFLVAFAEIGLGYFPLFFGVAPKLLLTMVFLMAVYDDEASHFYIFLVIGLIYDAMQAAPLGFTTGAMILMHLLGYAVKGRLQLASHSMLWMQFALVLIVLMFYAWLGIALSHQAIPAISGFVFQYSISVLLLPLMLGTYHLELSLLDLIRKA